MSLRVTQRLHNPASFRDGTQPRPSDVFIAVMGVTGAGKSTFISQCCDKKPAIGHTLEACTLTVDVYPYYMTPTTTVYLIDTPGFDDTSRSDDEVLSEIATWLTDSYTAKIRLSGIIYLHRITDVRMQGSAKKNLFMFKKLCGPEALKNVILITTMWEKVSEKTGDARETELMTTPDFWGWMMSQGSRVFRHKNNKSSAIKLIRAALEENSHVTLALQQQMAEEKKSLEDTDAGQELHAEITRERERFERRLVEVQKQTKEALEARDQDSARQLQKMQAEYKQSIDELEDSRRRLKIDMEELHRQKYERIEARLNEAEKRHAEERRMAQDQADKLASALSQLDLAQKQLKSQPTPLAMTNTVVTVGGDRTLPYLRIMLSAGGGFFNFVGPLSTEQLGDLAEWTYSLLGDINLGDLSKECLLDTPRNISSVKICSFGPNRQHYWKHDDLSFRYNFHGLMRQNVTLKILQSGVQVCAFGRQGAYIVATNSTTLWNLGGAYGGLGDWITKKVKREGKGIIAAVLNLTNDDSMVICVDGAAWLQTNNDNLRMWKRWVTAQYGIVF